MNKTKLRVGAAVVSLLALGHECPAAEDPATAGRLDVVAAIAPIPESSDRALALVIDLPGTDEAANGAVAVAEGELRIVVADPSGVELGSTMQPFAVAESGMQLYSAYRLPAGGLVVAASVVDLDGEVRSTWSERFAAAGAGVAEWASAPLLFAERTGWQGFRTSESGRTDIPFPFIDPTSGAFLPLASLRVATGAPIELRSLVASPSGEFPFLRARWSTTAGETSEVAVEVLASQASPVPGLWMLRLRTGSPASAGDYGLELAFVAPGGETGALSPRGVHVRVVDAASLESTRTAAQPEPEPELVYSTAGDAVVAAARLLVASDFDRAARALVEAERAEIAGAGPRATGRRVDALRHSELDTCRRLIGRQPAAGFPLAYLFARAHEEFVAGRDTFLLLSDRSFLRGLLDLFVSAAGPNSRSFAADVLALVHPATALELDPNHHLALLRIAVGDPRRPIDGRAIEPLRRLVAAYPDDAHGRLRLAIALRQRGDLDAAARELATVTSGPGPDWVREVAFGELAALDYRRRDREGAEAVLRDGIEKLGAPQLYLQLGAYLDSWNRTQEAVSIVNRMPVERAGERETGRHRLSRGAQDEIAETLARVRVRAGDELDSLREALAAEPAVPGALP